MKSTMEISGGVVKFSNCTLILTFKNNIQYTIFMLMRSMQKNNHVAIVHVKKSCNDFHANIPHASVLHAFESSCK